MTIAHWIHQCARACGVAQSQFVWWFQRRRQLRHAEQCFDSLKIALSLGRTLNAQADLVDVSVNGLASVNCASDVRIEAGQVLKNCAMILLGVGRIVLDLQVKYATPSPSGQGGPVKRIVCDLGGPSPDLRQLIKHYVMGLRPSVTTP